MLSIWDKPGAIDRLKELHGQKPELSFTQMAAALSGEFDLRITRNSAIGKAKRLGLPDRDRGAGFDSINGERRAKRVYQRKPRLMVIKANSAGALRMVATVDADLEPVKVADVQPLHIGLQDLTESTCKYPYGEGPFSFCGCPTISGPYCVPHADLCFTAYQGERRAQTEKRKRDYLRGQRAA